MTDVEDHMALQNCLLKAGLEISSKWTKLPFIRGDASFTFHVTTCVMGNGLKQTTRNPFTLDKSIDCL